VAAFDRVIKQPVHAVAVVAIILRGVDPALGRDGVRAAGAVMKREAVHVVALLAERRRRGRPGETRSDHQDRVLAPRRRAHQLHLEPAPVPFLFNGPVRYPAVEHRALLQRQPIQPASTATGTAVKPAKTRIANTRETTRRAGVIRALFSPSVWNMLQM